MEVENQIDHHAGDKFVGGDDESSENHLCEEGRVNGRMFVENTDGIKTQPSAEKHGDMRISPKKNFNIIIYHSSGTYDE